MPEELAVAESVTSSDVSVAVDPALLNKPQRPEDGASNGDDLLEAQTWFGESTRQESQA